MRTAAAMAAPPRSLVEVQKDEKRSWGEFEAAMRAATRGEVQEWAKVVWSTPPLEFDAVLDADDLDALKRLKFIGHVLLKRSEGQLIVSFERKGGSEGAALALFDAIDDLRPASTAPAPRACCICDPRPVAMPCPCMLAAVPGVCRECANSPCESVFGAAFFVVLWQCALT